MLSTTMVLFAHSFFLENNFFKACIHWFIEACVTFNDTVSKLLLARLNHVPTFCLPFLFSVFFFCLVIINSVMFNLTGLHLVLSPKTLAKDLGMSQYFASLVWTCIPEGSQVSSLPSWPSNLPKITSPTVLCPLNFQGIYSIGSLCSKSPRYAGIWGVAKQTQQGTGSWLCYHHHKSHSPHPSFITIPSKH